MTNTNAEAGVSVPNPPRENLVRGLTGAIELRDTETATPTLVTRFSPFNEWTEINSAWEGHFLERFSPSAFDKTIAENRGGIKVLFQHGKDPQIGDKPLGTITDLRAEADGAYAEVTLFDTSYNRDLLEGLRAGVYGASHRFKVLREEFNRRPDASEHNPDGLPERTVVEAKLFEFGPVTFPAYEGATAGVRSLTDDYILRHILGEPERIRAVLEAHRPSPFTGKVLLDKVTYPDGLHEAAVRLTAETFAPSEDTPPIVAPVSPERRDTRKRKFKTNEEWLAWIASI